MTDRRRNLFVLLLIAGLLAASAFVITQKETRLGLDLKGGVSLIYQAKPTKQTQVTGEAVERTLDIMRKRVDQLGVAEPEIQRSGPDQIDVSLPDVQNADEAAQQVGTTAQLYFYDWEPNVLGPGCKPAPTDAGVTGGPAAGGGTGSLSHYDAVMRAASCPERASPTATTNGLFYLVDDKAKRVLAGPGETREDLDQEVANKNVRRGENQKVVEVKQGAIIVRAESADDKKPSNRFYVLRDQPALSGNDIRNPEQNFDSGAGGSGSPIVTFEFSDRGRAQWQETTRGIAQRGQEQFIPGQDPQSAYQHFAIVLDNELISVPFIDFQQNPDGIDGRNGSQIEGGFTIESAQRLSNLLKTGALPIKLELISASQVSATLGQQALDQGLVAGIAGFVIVAVLPARLLPRARRDRGRRAARLRRLPLRADQADPDHADAAGHRRPDPDHRRGRRREHRHLRTRQGGDPRRAVGRRRHRGRLQARACRRSSTPTSSPSWWRSSCSCSPPRGSRASPSSWASARSSRS